MKSCFIIPVILSTWSKSTETLEQTGVNTWSMCLSMDLANVYEPGCRHGSHAGPASREVLLQREKPVSSGSCILRKAVMDNLG